MDAHVESDLVRRAHAFAKKVHAGETLNKGSSIPYIVHPEDVADIVRRYGGGERLVALALLHDVLETDPTLQGLIIIQFGWVMGNRAYRLADPPRFKGLPTLERKKKQAEKFALEEPEIKLVKLADVDQNTKRAIYDPRADKTRRERLDYLRGNWLVAQSCSGVEPRLDQEFLVDYEKARSANSY